MILSGHMMPERRAGEGERGGGEQRDSSRVAWALCAVRRRVEEIISSHQ